MIRFEEDPKTNEILMRASIVIDKELYNKIPSEAFAKAVDMLIEGIAQSIVEQQLPEIIKKMDQQAIATLALARCANRIADELDKSK